LFDDLGDININGVTLKATVTDIIADKLNTLDPGVLQKIYLAVQTGKALSPEIPGLLTALGLTPHQLEGLEVLETVFAPQFSAVLSALLEAEASTPTTTATTSTSATTITHTTIKAKSAKKLVASGAAKPVPAAK
jgi:hypothetical protein